MCTRCSAGRNGPQVRLASITLDGAKGLRTPNPPKVAGIVHPELRGGFPARKDCEGSPQEDFDSMAMKILADCINCGACEPECPNTAISAGDSIYVVDPEKCTEIVGAYDNPRCVEVCPVDGCIVPDPENAESKEGSNRSTPDCTDVLPESPSGATHLRNAPVERALRRT